MSPTPNKYSPQTNVQPPRCPYSSTDLLEVNAYQWTKAIAIGMGVTLCIYCPNVDCRKMLGTQILIVPHAEEASMIARPS